MNSASLCSLAGRYDNPTPPRFLTPIASLKIPAQATGRTLSQGSVDGGKNVPLLTAGLVLQFSDGKFKQKDILTA
jgi:hypothetical protein